LQTITKYVVKGKDNREAIEKPVTRVGRESAEPHEKAAATGQFLLFFWATVPKDKKEGAFVVRGVFV
jgi:hypothetical protein